LKSEEVFVSLRWIVMCEVKAGVGEGEALFGRGFSYVVGGSKKLKGDRCYDVTLRRRQVGDDKLVNGNTSTTSDDKDSAATTATRSSAGLLSCPVLVNQADREANTCRWTGRKAEAGRW